ncbi:hypothetical protein ACH4S8_04895 [Streptomyces sp. NPDC021080]|uniref:hypothetical protein n=1 Tax=Streptomyces sp. NPDC021080 TaxID=3365110 RepID=UPI003789C8AA
MISWAAVSTASAAKQGGVLWGSLGGRCGEGDAVARSPRRRARFAEGCRRRADQRVGAVDLAMGNRADVLIRGDAPGRYELRDSAVPRPLMTVEVAGAADG